MNARTTPGVEPFSGTSLFILGSCVSRDAFGPHTEERFRIVGYVARTSWGSAFANRSFPGIALDGVASPFQRRMVELDTGKGLGDLLSATTADTILIDLIDERFDLFIDRQGAVCTVTPELLSTGFLPDQADGMIVRSGSERFFECWEQGWRRLYGLLRERDLLRKVKVNRVFWSSSHEDGSPFGAGQTPARIASANRYLERLYVRLVADLPPGQFIDFPPALMRGALQHRWGSSPFHYVDQFYRHMAHALAGPGDMPKAATPLPPQTAPAPDAAFRSAAPPAGPVVLALHSVVLDGQLQWHDLRVPQGAILHLDCRIHCDSAAPERHALLVLECRSAEGALLPPVGFALSYSETLGHHRLLAAGEGGVPQSVDMILPIGFASVRIGLRSGERDGRFLLQDLRLRLVPRRAPRRTPATIISVDVEALPGRAEQDSVERLIFGRFGDGRSVGIPHLCDLFDRVGAKATFFVDYSTCDLHGEQGIFAASELLKARGHDVQLHMHSEVLVRQRGWPAPDTGIPTFDAIDTDVARACLEYGIDRFQRNLGHRPRIFRPGGMKHSRNMVLAVRQAGMEAVSSLYRGRGGQSFPQTRDEALLRWDNGVLEAPLDFALDPLLSWGANRRAMSTLLECRAARPLLSVLIHSTSLLFRALDNHPSHFTGYCRAYESRLEEYLAWFAAQGNFITYSDLLDSAATAAPLVLDDYYPREATGTTVADGERQLDFASIAEPRAAPTYDLTLSVAACRAEPDQILRQVPAPQLPLKLAPGQRLEAVTAQDGNHASGLAYILSGQKAYLMRQRCVLPGGDALRDAIGLIFRRHPRVSLVLAQSAMEEIPVADCTSRTQTRSTYVLDLPADFDDYRHRIISKKHRSDMERKERTVTGVVPCLHFVSLRGEQLDRSGFERAAELIESRLRHKVGGTAGTHSLFTAADALRQWEIYREHGEVVQLWDGNDIHAAALCLHFEQDCFFMASGHRESAPRHSLGNLLLYRLIESLIGRGVRRLHLGGGDFDYKSRYGAVERPLYNFEFARPGDESLKARILAALQAGESPARLEQDLAAPLETLLGPDFEPAVGVDFNAVVENDVLGTDGQARRYQATSREAFMMMMKHVPLDDTETFVDIGCGKGKMLYYAAQLGYRSCIGVELAAVLLRQAQANLARLQLPADILLMHRDASRLPSDELAGASLFYLYNPFSEAIMRAFLGCLLKSQRERPRRLRVVYCNAQFEAPFVEARFYPAKVFTDGEDGWRFGHAVIYERDPDQPSIPGPSIP